MAKPNIIPSNATELYNLYFQPKGLVYKLVAKKTYNTLSKEDVKDLVHDVYVRALQQDSLGTYKAERGSFATILWNVVKTVCINAYHADNRTVDIVGSLVESDEEEFTLGEYDLSKLNTVQHTYFATEAQAINELIIEELQRFVNDAKARGKTKRDKSLQLFLSLLYEGYGQSEIMERLQVTDSTVDNWTKYLAGAII
jgi:RNA polymerase sigma factor (sigma-70 family)